MPKRVRLIHPEILERLGYSADMSTQEVLQDWKSRLQRVCKPCWELKYCPYGPLVEQSPKLPAIRASMEPYMAYLKECVDTGLVGNVVEVVGERRELLERWLADESILVAQVVNDLHQTERLRVIGELVDRDERMAYFAGGELPPIQVYRTKYDASYDYKEEDFEPDEWARIMEAVEERKSFISAALQAGVEDGRTPIEPFRREWFEEQLSDYRPEDYPEDIPETFKSGECSIFGHICPVFFVAEALTESSEERRIGRKHLSFAKMMRIVRRDDYRCQHCYKKLQDTEVEFDHIIPVSRGGSSEEHNMRLTCFDCNRDKGDNYIP